MRHHTFNASLCAEFLSAILMSSRAAVLAADARSAAAAQPDPLVAMFVKLGELKNRELRRRAEQALGTRFGIKAFHDQILLGGSMPLTILEERVDRWTSATRAR